MPRNDSSSRRLRRVKNTRRKGFRRRAVGLDLDNVRKGMKPDASDDSGR